MTDKTPEARAAKELDAILGDMDRAGTVARRAAKRIRKAVTVLLTEKRGQEPEGESDD